MGITTTTLNKIEKLLKMENTPLSYSQISQKLILRHSAVVEGIRYLKEVGKVETMTNGKITLVKNREIKIKDAIKKKQNIENGE